MVYLNKITGVQKFCVINDFPIVLEKNTLKVGGEEFPFQSSVVFPFHDNILSGKDFQFNLKKKKIEYIDGASGYFYTGINYKEELLFSGKDYKLLKSNDTKFVSEFPHFQDGSIIAITENSYVVLFPETLMIINKIDRNSIWTKKIDSSDTNRDLYIQGVPQLIVEKLYVPLCDRKDNSFLETLILDVRTGEREGIIEKFIPSTQTDGACLLMFDLRKIVKYNTNDSSIEELKFDNEFKEISEKVCANAYFNAPFCVSDNKAYFSTIDSRSSACFGVIDLMTKKLEYFEDMNESLNEFKRSVKDIKVSEKHVFVHCSDNTLFVYKK